MWAWAYNECLPPLSVTAQTLVPSFQFPLSFSCFADVGCLALVCFRCAALALPPPPPPPPPSLVLPSQSSYYSLPLSPAGLYRRHEALPSSLHTRIYVSNRRPPLLLCLCFLPTRSLTHPPHQPIPFYRWLTGLPRSALRFCFWRFSSLSFPTLPFPCLSLSLPSCSLLPSPCPRHPPPPH